MVAHWVLDKFDDHYGRAATIMRAQRELLVDGMTPDMAALARNRWELLRVLVGFQIFKHRDIFDPVIRNGSPSASARARALKADCAALGADVRTFVTTWSNGSADGQWAAFRTEALTLMDRIERGVAEQRRAVAAMVGPQTAPSARLPTPRALPAANAGAAR